MFYTFTFIILSLLPNFALAQETFKSAQNRYTRVRQARENRESQIDSLFDRLNINYPPHEIIIVAYKNERILELWAKSENLGAFKLVKKYKFTAFCGSLGPKRKRGDLQIPEGFYHIDHFNPLSNFHLSMKINYPNRSDTILGYRTNLGGEIRIHGSFVTIGCIPIGDEAIEELYIVGVDTKSAGQENIPVYIFPLRMDSLSMATLSEIASEDAVLLSFWQNLKQGYDIFEMTHQKLIFNVNEKGRYVFQNSINSYPWMTIYDNSSTLINRIDVPPGYERIPTASGSFADWLRNLPLKQNNPPVYLYDGSEKSYQDGHHTVVEIDVGNKDLQQCADAIIRLYAEYLYSKSSFDEISFQLTNGDKIGFRKWISGYRPSVDNNQVRWHERTDPDSSYERFRDYLNFIFTYAGSYSLNQQLEGVQGINDMKIGDVLIQGGFPGHAVLIIDMAVNEITNENIFLLCQSYMPAQDIHILKNLNDPVLSPWYRLNFGDSLYTPEWTFTREDLKRF